MTPGNWLQSDRARLNVIAVMMAILFAGSLALAHVLTSGPRAIRVGSLAIELSEQSTRVNSLEIRLPRQFTSQALADEPGQLRDRVVFTHPDDASCQLTIGVLDAGRTTTPLLATRDAWGRIVHGKSDGHIELLFKQRYRSGTQVGARQVIYEAREDDSDGNAGNSNGAAGGGRMHLLAVFTLTGMSYHVVHLSAPVASLDQARSVAYTAVATLRMMCEGAIDHRWRPATNDDLRATALGGSVDDAWADPFALLVDTQMNGPQPIVLAPRTGQPSLRVLRLRGSPDVSTLGEAYAPGQLLEAEFVRAMSRKPANSESMIVPLDVSINGQAAKGHRVRLAFDGAELTSLTRDLTHVWGVGRTALVIDYLREVDGQTAYEQDTAALAAALLKPMSGDSRLRHVDAKMSSDITEPRQGGRDSEADSDSVASASANADDVDNASADDATFLTGAVRRGVAFVDIVSRSIDVEALTITRQAVWLGIDPYAVSLEAHWPARDALRAPYHFESMVAFANDPSATVITYDADEEGKAFRRSTVRGVATRRPAASTGQGDAIGAAPDNGDSSQETDQPNLVLIRRHEHVMISDGRSLSLRTDDPEAIESTWTVSLEPGFLPPGGGSQPIPLAAFNGWRDRPALVWLTDGRRPPTAYWATFTVMDSDETPSAISNNSTPDAPSTTGVHEADADRTNGREDGPDDPARRDHPDSAGNPRDAVESQPQAESPVEIEMESTAAADRSATTVESPSPVVTTMRSDAVGLSAANGYGVLTLRPVVAMDADTQWYDRRGARLHASLADRVGPLVLSIDTQFADRDELVRLFPGLKEKIDGWEVLVHRKR